MTYNRITAEIGESRRITTRPISYQYDTVQILMLTAAEGIELPEFYQVDFCVIGDEDTVTMVGSLSGGAPIPDSLLRQGENLMAYLVLTGTESDVQTRYEITIPVNERPTRSGIELTDEQQAQVDSLVEALNEGVDRAEAAAEAIQNMGVEAETLPEGSAAAVEKTVDPETGDVTLTFGIPRGSQGNPGTTPDFQIGTVETLPATSPATATITGTPAEPVLNLGIPQGQKGDPGSGGTTDYRELENKPQINGHTLNGNQSASDLGLGTYSKPGTGIPKTDLASDVQQSLGKADSALQSAPVSSVAGKTGAVTLAAGDVSFDDSATYAAGSVGAELSAQSNAIDAKAPLIINTASGNIASFADGADGAQIRKIVGTIVPVQSGTGDPSPDNVRPISGWTGANITRTGKNIFDKTNVLTSCAIVDNKISDHATYDLYFVPLKENTTYTFNRPAGTSSYPQFGLSEEYPQIGTTVSNYISLRYQNPYTFNSGNYKYALFALYKSMGNECSVVIGSDSIPNTEPYYGQTLPINWQTEAGTIYGGTLTLNEDGSADVVATWAKIKISDIRQNDISVSGYGASIFTSPLYYLPKKKNGENNVMSPIYKTTGSVSSSMEDLTMSGISNSGTIYIKDTRYTTVAEFFAAQKDTEIVYELRDSGVETHLPNIGELYTYLGTNNVWIDTGAITECDYPADTKLYIDGLTAPDEDMIANANIANGKYFVVNNQLYLSTAAIAAGASIVPGTNCTATNLAEALNALNT